MLDYLFSLKPDNSFLCLIIYFPCWLKIDHDSYEFILESGTVANTDDDDDEVRTSVLQNHVTATLCIEEFFVRTQYIYISPHISREVWRSRIKTVNTTHIKTNRANLFFFRDTCSSRPPFFKNVF
jgi:hypothetical protein